MNVWTPHKTASKKLQWQASLHNAASGPTAYVTCFFPLQLQRQRKLCTRKRASLLHTNGTRSSLVPPNGIKHLDRHVPNAREGEADCSLD
eukprot:1154023-Pelagomonas_calceolata.AAC.3